MSWNDGYSVLFSADKIKSFVILFCESKNEVHVLKVTVRDIENENAKTVSGSISIYWLNSFGEIEYEKYLMLDKYFEGIFVCES